MRRPLAPPSAISAAAVVGTALWHAGRAAGYDAIAAPGLWRIAAALDLAETVMPLFAIVAAGAAVTALVQPMAHVERHRPWPAALTLAVLIPLLLLPVPVTLLLALLPVASAAGVGRPVAIALAAAWIAPAIGTAALAVAAWRLCDRLRLTSAANDNQPAWPARGFSARLALAGSRRSSPG